MIRARFIALALVACGAPDETRVDPVFTPDAEIGDSVHEWAQRWSAATGRNITVGPGGIPVRSVDVLSLTAGLLDCGATKQIIDLDTGAFLRAELVEIDVTPPCGCPSLDYTVGHELAHALGGRHAEESWSLMAESAPTGVASIDEPALEMVCSSFECAAFVPEEPTVVVRQRPWLAGPRVTRDQEYSRGVGDAVGHGRYSFGQDAPTGSPGCQLHGSKSRLKLRAASRS